MVTQYEEINNEKLIKQVLEDEINKFTETLDTGLDILDKSMKKIINSKSKKEISGELLFLLYDTYGFPVDLSQAIAKENKFIVDTESFNILMKEQKEKSKKAKKFSADKSLSIITEQLSEFTGYVDEKNKAKILDIIIDNENVNEISNGQTGCVVIDVCPFYAESGGQIGDSGESIKYKRRVSCI